jgi:cysteine desulfurase/selenocysteine lyase
VDKLEDKIKNDFKILNGISYLDNAATTQKPAVVLDTLKNFYETTNANVHRGVYKISEQATRMLDDARKTFAGFINAKDVNIIFTKNATEGINQIANSLERTFMFSNKSSDTDNIVVTEIEHHSNFVPWQQLSKRNSLEFRIVPYDLKKEYIEPIAKYVDEHTKIVAFTAMSNVSGLIIDVDTQIKTIRKKNKDTIIIVDATQYIAHNKLNINEWDADFIVFSAHKIYGTTGVGIVYGKSRFLEKIEPFFFGGDMISIVDAQESTWAEIPSKFEAGTLDAAGIIASSEGIKYFQKNFDEYQKHEKNLKNYALKRLKTIKGLAVIGHDAKNNKNNNYGPVISFIMKDIHPHDLATICDRHNVYIRAGHHCAQPFMKKLGVSATSRASLAFYNTIQDIDNLVYAINDAKKVLQVK